MENLDLAKLEAVIRLCRKTGVSTITVGDVTLTLTAEAPPSTYKRKQKSLPKTDFEKAIAEAKDDATRAKLKYIQEQMGMVAVKTEAEANPQTPNDMSMLFWSSGDSGEAQQ